MEYYFNVLKNFSFEGRASRKEFWSFFFINYSILVVLGLYAVNSMIEQKEDVTGIVIFGIYLFATFVQGLAVFVRRLHDTGRSGWWVLLNAIPNIGIVILLIFCCFDSQEGSNEYGENPKGKDIIEKND